GGLSFAEWYALECAKIKSAAARRAVFGDGDPREDAPLVITADTVVSPDGVRIFGKPADEADATLMLKTLSGTKHQVVGGICVTDGRKTLTATVTTYVKFRELGDREIEDYVSTGEPFGKAGSYAIQETGDHFVEMIDGDYPNIVGLSLDETQRMLAAFD
ncbi:MAG: Maf family protein, partial [Clostridia bacterium]|nr:Maf family protein [Clostridia bacterium]